MAEDITTNVRAALDSIPAVLKLDVIWNDEEALGIAAQIDVGLALSIQGEDDQYAGSVRVKQSDFTQIPRVGSWIEVQDKQHPDGSETMVRRRILNVVPDQFAASWRIDYAARYSPDG